MISAQSQRLFCLMSLSAVIAIASCSAPDSAPDPCDTFPKGLVEALKTDVTVEETEKSVEIEAAMERVEDCYPSMEYSRDGHPLIFERVSLGSDGKFYIFYSFTGILDDMVVFRLLSSGEIDAAFSYSPLSRFAVPD
ncbi:hypothetical protein [Erythrobacter sp. MTPC3]|uniref:hypothetical protein n=1 Tax=Erythrobacter sp. MTPC3 TaxID=3056564 RepID=UPI0036F1B8F2